MPYHNVFNTRLIVYVHQGDLATLNKHCFESAHTYARVTHTHARTHTGTHARTHNTHICNAILACKLLGRSRIFSNLTHWGRVTHICVSQLTIIVSDNGLSPDRRQAIIWSNAGILLIGPLGTNFSEIVIEMLTFSFKKMRLKVSSVKRRPFCLGLNVLTNDFPDSNVIYQNRIHTEMSVHCALAQQVIIYHNRPLGLSDMVYWLSCQWSVVQQRHSCTD